MTQSHKAEVKTGGASAWVGNGMRFPTAEQAKQYVNDLRGRWFAVTDTRIVESDQRPTHTIDEANILTAILETPTFS